MTTKQFNNEFLPEWNKARCAVCDGGLEDGIKSTLISALEDYLDKVKSEIKDYKFTPGEIEVMRNAAKEGFTWFAKEQTNEVYAHRYKPGKNTASWSDTIGFCYIPFHAFDTLSFSDPEPYHFEEGEE